MFKNKIKVNAPASKLYEFIKNELAVSLGLEPNKLLKQKVKQDIKTGKVNSTITQEVTELVENKKITLRTYNSFHDVTSTYELFTLSENVTKLQLTEIAKSSDRNMNNNYSLLSFPVFNLIPKYRLKKRLKLIKYKVEDNQ